jgi:hypothetical protein
MALLFTIASSFLRHLYFKSVDSFMPITIDSIIQEETEFIAATAYVARESSSFRQATPEAMC